MKNTEISSKNSSVQNTLSLSLSLSLLIISQVSYFYYWIVTFSLLLISRKIDGILLQIEQFNWNSKEK